MESYEIQFRAINKLGKAREELLWNQKRAELFADAASSLLSSEYPEKIVFNICNKAMQFLDCDVFFNYLFDEEKQVLHLNAYAGIPEEIGKSIEWLDLGVAVCGCVGRDGCRIIADDIQNIPDERTELVKSFGVQAYACHPLISKGETIGTLSFGAKSRTSFSDAELEVMRVITDYVATAMERKIAEDKLRKSRDNLELKVQERTADLDLLIGELKRSNEELQQFAYVSSHDLQEPLRTISSFTQLLERRYKGQFDSDADEFMDYIVDAAKRMQTLIKDLLQYSRVTTQGKGFQPVDVEEVLNIVVSNLKTLIDEDNVEIVYDKLPTVNADERQLIQLFQNLIGNAIKFRKQEEPPKIHISARKDEDKNEYVFSVADNGIGMEKEYFERIFVIFQRLHTIEEYKGTGIGLSVAKKIVERHGGRIWVESEFGVGSTFYFTIPLTNQ